MAFALSRNLKLRIDSNLTANAKYNLNRIDLLGASVLVDSLDNLHLRANSDIVLEPNSNDLGGSGIGGEVSLGTSTHSLDSVVIYADSVSMSAPLGLFDQATGGSKYLNLRYKSDLNGSVDTIADRVLSLDLDGADRSLILGGNLTLSGGSLGLTVSGSSSLTLPLTGTLSTLAGTETLSNKSISGDLRFSNGSFYSGFQASGLQASSLSYTLPASGPSGNQVLRANSATPTTLEWATISGGGGSIDPFEGDWLAADGTSKVINHALGSTDVDVTIIDLSSSELIEVDSVVVTDSNNITLSASEAPATTWRVVIQANN